MEIWKGARDEDPTRRRTIDLDSENGEEVRKIIIIFYFYWAIKARMNYILGNSC